MPITLLASYFKSKVKKYIYSDKISIQVQYIYSCEANNSNHDRKYLKFHNDDSKSCETN